MIKRKKNCKYNNQCCLVYWLDKREMTHELAWKKDAT